MGNSKSTKHHHVSLSMPQKERDLHLAVMANDREAVRGLINAGANVNYPWSNPAVPSVKDSTTPLIAAVSLNHVEISMVVNQSHLSCSLKSVCYHLTVCKVTNQDLPFHWPMSSLAPIEAKW